MKTTFTLFLCLSGFLHGFAQSWYLQSVPMNSSMYFTSIDFPDSTTGWAVGYDGTIIATGNAGVNWSIQPTSNSYPLYDVDFYSNTNGLACGGAGTMMVTSDAGANWNSFAIGTNNWYSISSVSANFQCVVGSGGAIRIKSGWSNWGLSVSGVTNNLLGSFFHDEQIGFAVGDSSTILKTTTGGGSWQVKNSGGNKQLLKIHFPSLMVGYAVGEAGNFMKTIDGGETWTTITVPYTDYINDVFFTSDLEGYFVTNAGTIYRTINGGNNWTVQSSNIADGQILDGITFVSPNHGFACGGWGSGIVLHYDVSAGVSEEKEELFTIYPNPASDCITLISTDQLTENEVSISSTDGKIRTKQLDAEHKISVADLTPGLYFIHTGAATPQRFIKL